MTAKVSVRLLPKKGSMSRVQIAFNMIALRPRKSIGTKVSCALPEAE